MIKSNFDLDMISQTKALQFNILDKILIKKRICWLFVSKYDGLQKLSRKITENVFIFEKKSDNNLF